MRWCLAKSSSDNSGNAMPLHGRHEDGSSTAAGTPGPGEHPADPVGAVHGREAGGGASGPESGGLYPEPPGMPDQAGQGGGDWPAWMKRSLLEVTGVWGLLAGWNHSAGNRP